LVAFLTHGGMNSITETLNRGKPVIVVPFYGDQIRNAVLAKRAGFGIMLPVSDLQDEKKLSDAFEQIINDKRFTQKAEQLSRMIAKRPNSAKEQLIRHVEFAAEFGQIPNFDPYGRKMSFISYFMLDIIVPFITAAALVFALLCCMCYRLLKKLILRNNSRNEPQTAKKQQ
uniref:glucuronosyltransferase n=1 Tax=Gongylonema pulchrum TaxID=637853 RepID=A0A183D6G5_9BILA